MPQPFWQQLQLSLKQEYNFLSRLRIMQLNGKQSLDGRDQEASLILQHAKSRIKDLGIDEDQLTSISESMKGYYDSPVARIGIEKSFEQRVLEQIEDMISALATILTREIGYQYGSQLKTMFARMYSIDPAKAPKSVKCFGSLTAMRILDNAVISGIPFRTDEVVDLIAGAGLKDAKTIAGIDIERLLPGSHGNNAMKTSFSEAFLRCGYLQPHQEGYRFFGRRNGDVRQEETNTDNATHEDNNPELADWYSYTSVPENYPSSLLRNIEQHFPLAVEPVSQPVQDLLQFPYRYVSYQHIVAYLRYCKAASPAAPFNAWLQASYPKLFKVTEGELHAVYRGTPLSQAGFDALEPGLRFEKGKC
jgi:hypothetical protein